MGCPTLIWSDNFCNVIVELCLTGFDVPPPPTHRHANSCRTVRILNSKMAFLTHFDRWPEYNECSNVLSGRGRVFLKINIKHRPQKIYAPNRVVRFTPSQPRHKKSCRMNRILHPKRAFLTSFKRWPKYNEHINVLTGRE